MEAMGAKVLKMVEALRVMEALRAMGEVRMKALKMLEKMGEKREG